MRNGDAVVKSFWEGASGKAKKALAIRLVSIILFGTVLALSVGVSVAWFANSQRSENSGMDIVLATDTYRLLVKKPLEYDRTAGGDPVYPGISTLKTTLHDDYDYLIASGVTSTASSALLATELVNADAEKGKYDLRPGSYGTLTFYLDPLAAGTLELRFSLSLGGFANVYDNEGDITSIERVTSESVANYLQGHILFFTGRPSGSTPEDFVYTGFVDGTFDYSTQGKTPVTADDATNGCYEITLYWEWLMTYDEIEDTDKFPDDVRDYFDDHRSYFLAKNVNSTDPTECNEGYNDADQIIGDNVNYIAVYVSDR